MAAEAGRLDRHVGAGHGLVEEQLNLPCLDGLAALDQTLVQAMQAPDIARVLASTAQCGVQAKVRSINGLRFLKVSLLQQKCSQGVTG